MFEPSQPRPQVLTPAALRDWQLPALGERASKKERGTVLVIGGNRRTPGAVLLAGTAGLRAGAGTLQMAGPEPIATALGIHVPESLVVPLPENGNGDVSRRSVDVLAEQLDAAQSVLIGPGLLDVGETTSLVADLLPRIGPQTAVVIDAFGLRNLTPEVAASVAGRLILTPNLSEGAYLLNRDPDQMGDLLEAAAAAAERFRAVVALHGHIADPSGGRWLDQSGHAGLGTSGSGDVLAGLVAGMLARRATPAQAACWGTYLHSTAGERLAARIGRVGFLARELLDEAPLVLTELQA